MSDDITEAPPSMSENVMEDIFMWRRRKLALFVLVVTTATWVLLNIYGFNSITLVSWTAIAIITLLFLWGNLLRLLNKEEPELSGLEMSEEFTTETVKACRKLAEEGIRWMFQVSAEREWFVFARTVIGLWILSRIGNLLDLQTFLFIGLVIGLTIPTFWEKQKGKIKTVLNKSREKSREAYNVAYEKIIKKKSKTLGMKEKDTEKKTQ